MFKQLFLAMVIGAPFATAGEVEDRISELTAERNALSQIVADTTIAQRETETRSSVSREIERYLRTQADLSARLSKSLTEFNVVAAQLTRDLAADNDEDKALDSWVKEKVAALLVSTTDGGGIAAIASEYQQKKSSISVCPGGRALKPARELLDLAATKLIPAALDADLAYRNLNLPVDYADFVRRAGTFASDARAKADAAMHAASDAGVAAQKRPVCEAFIAVQVLLDLGQTLVAVDSANSELAGLKVETIINSLENARASADYVKSIRRFLTGIEAAFEKELVENRADRAARIASSIDPTIILIADSVADTPIDTAVKVSIDSDAAEVKRRISQRARETLGDLATVKSMTVVRAKTITANLTSKNQGAMSGPTATTWQRVIDGPAKAAGLRPAHLPQIPPLANLDDVFTYDSKLAAAEAAVDAFNSGATP